MAIGPPACPAKTAPGFSACSGEAAASMIRPTRQLPSDMTGGLSATIDRLLGHVHPVTIASFHMEGQHDLAAISVGAHREPGREAWAHHAARTVLRAFLLPRHRETSVVRALQSRWGHRGPGWLRESDPPSARLLAWGSATDGKRRLTGAHLAHMSGGPRHCEPAGQSAQERRPRVQTSGIRSVDEHRREVAW
jgi:hypothetical protein